MRLRLSQLFNNSKNGNSLLYLLVIASVMAVSIASILQILQPLQSVTTATNERNLLMEQVAKQHIRTLMQQMRVNSLTYINLGNYDAANCSNGFLPCYQTLNNGTWASVSPTIGTLSYTDWKLNGQAVTVTSTLAQTGLRRLNEPPYSAAFAAEVTVTSGGFSQMYRYKWPLDSFYCTLQTPGVGLVRNVPFALNTGAPAGSRMANRMGLYMEFPDARNICRMPVGEGGSNLTCLYNASHADLNRKVYLLDVASGLDRQDQYKNSTVILEDAYPSAPVADAVVFRNDLTTDGSTCVVAFDNAAPWNVTSTGTINGIMTPDQVVAKKFLSKDSTGSYEESGYVMFLDRSAGTNPLRLIYAKFNPIACDNTSRYLEVSAASNNNTGVPVGYTGFDPTGLRGAAEGFSTNDKLALSKTGVVVVTDRVDKRMYANKIYAPTGGTITEPYLKSATWTTSDIPAPLSGVTVNEFGRPILDASGQYAIIPALVNEGGTNQVWILGFRITTSASEKVDPTTNKLNCGTPSNLVVLMEFDQSGSYTTENNGALVNNLSNLFAWFDESTQTFNWVVSGTGLESSKTVYQWDSRLWGLTSSAATASPAANCGAVTLKNWLNGSTTLNNAIWNKNYSGTRSTATTTSPSTGRWVGSFYTVRQMPYAPGDANLIASLTDFTVSSARASGRLSMRGSSSQYYTLTDLKGNNTQVDLSVSAPHQRILTNAPNMGWEFNVTDAVSDGRIDVYSYKRRQSFTFFPGIPAWSFGGGSITPGEGSMGFFPVQHALAFTDSDGPLTSTSVKLYYYRPYCYTKSMVYSYDSVPFSPSGITGFNPTNTFFGHMVPANYPADMGQYGRYEQ